MSKHYANATWEGNLVSGKGRYQVRTNGIEGNLTFSSRFEDDKSASSPEELIGAALASCFSMAFAHALDQAGSKPEKLETEATVTLARAGDGFSLNEVFLKTKGKVGGITRDKFIEIAEKSKQNCPVSRALGGNKNSSGSKSGRRAASGLITARAANAAFAMIKEQEEIMALNFEKYAQEGNSFLKELASNLGHPEETGRTGIILRDCLHTLRDRLSFGESLNLISQLPMFIKALYVDGWEYSEKPLPIKKKEEFYEEVKKHQDQYGEKQFDWKISTADIVSTVFSSLGRYISSGEFEDIVTQMPKPLKALFSQHVTKPV